VPAADEPAVWHNTAAQGRSIAQERQPATPFAEVKVKRDARLSVGSLTIELKSFSAASGIFKPLIIH
jgi:hypothetical protein